MLKHRAAFRRRPVFPDRRKSGHKRAPNLGKRDVMTTTLVWTGVALWLAVNASLALRMYAVQPGRTAIRFDRTLRLI
jgi:hypothetical protein